jgi:hypothetical protein
MNKGLGTWGWGLGSLATPARDGLHAEGRHNLRRFSAFTLYSLSCGLGSDFDSLVPSPRPPVPVASPLQCSQAIMEKEGVTAFPLSPRPSGIVPAAALPEGN